MVRILFELNKQTSNCERAALIQALNVQLSSLAGKDLI